MAIKILGIETATLGCSVALRLDNECIERFEVAPRQHGKLLLPMVDELLAEGGIGLKTLDAIAFGRGPGMFTGLRMAAGVTQGLAYGANLPVISVSSLQTLAQTAYEKSQAPQILAALDARMKELYWCPYQIDNGLMMPTAKESLTAPQAVQQLEGDFLGAGSGWDEHHSQLPNIKWLKDLYPQSSALTLLALKKYHDGKLLKPEEALPTYLRAGVLRNK